MHHGAGGGHKIGLADMVAGFFFLDDAANEFCQFVVRRAAEHLVVQIMVPDGKQAGANLAVGGNANAAAVSAKRMRYRRDDADFSDAVVKAITAGGLSPRAGAIPPPSPVSPVGGTVF